MKKKLLVLSMDAMVCEDLAYLRTRPNFSRLMADCAQAEAVRTIYPSITYPAHVSIATGCTPGAHGIYNNIPFKPFRDAEHKYPHWYLYSKYIAVEDIFTAAKRAGCTTASVYWPITGCHPDIDYIIDEYFFHYPKDEDPERLFARLGANEAALRAVRENLRRLPTTRGDAELKLTGVFDDFIMGCACSLIRNEQPDVMLIHNCWLDDLRHRHGVFNEKVTEGLDQTDLWLGEVVRAMKDAGVYEDTDFVLLSDHGQLDFTRRIRLNLLLQRGGFLDLAPDGSLYDYRAFAQSNGMSAAVHLRFPEDRQLRQEVYDYLKKLAAEGKWGFDEVFTKEEVAEKYGYSGPFSFVVESDGTATFAEDYVEPLEAPVIPDSHRLGSATHGYRPEKGPQPVFVARGPDFRPGASLPLIRIIDEAPTFAHILGQKLPQAEGRVLTELLR